MSRMTDDRQPRPVHIDLCNVPRIEIDGKDISHVVTDIDVHRGVDPGGEVVVRIPLMLASVTNGD